MLHSHQKEGQAVFEEPQNSPEKQDSNIFSLKPLPHLKIGSTSTVIDFGLSINSYLFPHQGLIRPMEIYPNSIKMDSIIHPHLWSLKTTK